MSNLSLTTAAPTTNLSSSATTSSVSLSLSAAAVPPPSSAFYSPHKAADDELEALGHPPTKNVARALSYAVGGLALVMIVTAIVLLIFLRHHSTVITTVIPTNHVLPTILPPLLKVALGAPSQQASFNVFNFSALVTPVASVSDTSPVLSGTPSPPDVDPGQLPFDDTIQAPLQIPPQGFGWVAITPDGQQWFSSLPNGDAQFGQYYYTEGLFKTNDEVYRAQNSYGNSILFCRTDPVDPDNDTVTGVNASASSVGSVGYASIAMSDDGTRLYLAYRQPLMGASESQQIFPFLQLAGHVATFTRPEGTDGSSPSSTDWSYACPLELVNPYGSQTAQFDQICDPLTGNLLTGDDFGSLIRTTTNLRTGNRVLAVRSNFGLRLSDGAFVAVYEETSDGIYVISGLVFLMDGTTTFTLAEKIVFGRDFAVGNDALLSAVRTPASGCGVTTPRQELFFYLRNDTTLQWEYQQTLSAPATAANEDFGVSIVMNRDGTQAIVGSPHLPSGSTPGLGGHVYFYERAWSDPKVWTVTQALSDPLANVHADGAFGYFLSVDKQFLVLAVSANQNNVLNAPIVTIGTTPTNAKPAVVFLAINQAAAQLDVSTVQQQVFPDGIPTDWLDPLYGSQVALAFEDEGRTTLRVILTSPMNQLAFYYTLPTS